MNDPLRDNRIFPEEMHQKAAPRETSSNLSWLWTIIGILLLALLGWYIYKMYAPAPADDVPSFEEQEQFFQSIKNSSPEQSVEEHDEAANAFFGIDTR